MKTIFKNEKQIKKSDIPIQILRGTLFLIVLYIISKIRFINREVNSSTFLIMGFSLITLFIYLIINNKTIQRIEKDEKSGKLIFAFNRQLRRNKIVELDLSNIKIELKKIQIRASSKKVLIISDEINQVKLNTNQVGVSENDLTKIKNKIEALHTTTAHRK